MSKFINHALLALVLVFFFTVGLQKCADERNYRHWPTAPAHLLSAQVAVGHRKSGGRYFVVETNYEFTVAGKVYSSNLNGIGITRFESDTKALQSLNDLKSRSELSVHYDPSNPEKSVLIY